jgi:tRNA-2-methylthio-N6-dimethylallyladenosine synthase
MGEELLEQAPYVDLVMGPDGYRGLPEAIAHIETARGAGWARRPLRARRDRIQLAVLDLDLGESYEGLGQRRASGVTAWVTIQRGCDHRCTFCIVPYVRGPEKNRQPEEVLAEVREIAVGGVSEVTLLGQTVNSYRHGDWTFPRLLREVARLPGIRRVRFTSPHPIDVTAELVHVMATENAVCEQLHLPLQSGSDEVLRRMLRRYSVSAYLETVAMVREAIPDVAISTDVIVAFPGETEADFEATLDVMPAAWSLPDEVARARLDRLIKVARDVQGQVNGTELGRVEEVLVERKGRDPGQVLGRTRRNKVVTFDGEISWIGGYHRVVLERTTGVTFAGRVVEEPVRAERA